RSCQVRPSVPRVVPLGLLLVWKLAIGFVRPPVIELPSAAARYFPTLNLSAVLPVPNRSYTTAARGVMSLYRVPVAAGMTTGVGTQGLGPTVCSGKAPRERS